MAKKIEIALEIIEEARKMHPYRVQGDLATWSLFNEGWQKCCDEVEKRIKEKL